MKKKLKIVGLILKIAPIAYKVYKKLRQRKGKKVNTIKLPPRH